MSVRRERQPSGRTNHAAASAASSMMSPDSSNAAQGSRPGPSIEFSPIASKQVYHEGTAASTSNANTHRGLFASPDSARTALTTTSKKRAHTHRNLRELLATRRAIHNEPVSLTNDPKKLARVCSELDMNDFDEDKVYDILTERSVDMAKAAVARRFFGTIENRGQTKDMRVGLEDRPLTDRVEVMMGSDFTRSLRALKYRQRVIEGKGSRQMQGCLSFAKIPEVGDPEFLARQERQYKPYAKGYEENSHVRTFNELRLRRVRESVDAGEVWRQKTKGVPEGVSFKRVSAFKLDNGD